ncbi:hypothetical protein [Bifidobacterium oedipodis]|uniref:DUF5648 domain-containing protein n=1 Tax=Bifidobacterium oedipodis TaxID=2675322 RepID=A0A7Y0ERA4_9BIFI|nr:hypothetical protein [Bifidobacterium sp. DSM 109957]NMM94994.1 hypothetical protein [Bifidobacterium sp. DSM 109957]
MTGNKNAWRAPLAGLASVAMIATMGVAASTANAKTAAVDSYNFTVTFNAKEGRIAGSGDETLTSSENCSDGSNTYTDDYDGAVKAFCGVDDGHLNYANNSSTANGKDHYRIEGRVASAPSAESVFTGWYLNGKKVVEGQTVNADTTLEAHYATRDTLVEANFYGSGVTNDDTVLTNRTDGFAAQDIPADAAADGKVVNYWVTTAGTVGVAENVQFTTEDLTDPAKLQAKLGNDATGRKVTLNLVAVAKKAAKITYAIPGADNVTVDVAYGDLLSDPTYPGGNRWLGPVLGENTVFQFSKWQYGNKTYTESGAVLDGAYLKPAEADAAYAVKYFTEINGKDRYMGTVYVLHGDTAHDKYQMPARNSGSTFTHYSNPAHPNKDHAYGDAFTGKIYGPTWLAAEWTQSAGVTFDWNIGGKKTTKSYAAGETFTMPSASEGPQRNGWAFYGWFVNRTFDNNPFNPFVHNDVIAADFQYVDKNNDGKADDTNHNHRFDEGDRVNQAGFPLSMFDNAEYSDDTKVFRIPAGTKLRITAQGTLQANVKVSNEVDSSTGKPAYTTKWIDVPSMMYGAWVRANKSSVNDLLNNAPIADKNGDVIAENKDFTNWPEYVKEVTDLQTKLSGSLTTDEYAKLEADIKAAQDKLVQTAPVKVYRLYNKWNGDHVYTTSQDEAASLSKLGWKAEGVQFNVTNKAFGNAKAVYRLYNAYNGEHLLTADKTEADGLVEAGWVYDVTEGAKAGDPYFYAPQGATTGVTRLFNPYETVGTHLYTTSSDEIAKNVKLGWIQENVLFNVVK